MTTAYYFVLKLLLSTNPATVYVGIQISNSQTDNNQMHNNTVLEDSVSTCNSDPVIDIRKEDEKVIVGENEMQSSSIFLDEKVYKHCL